MMIFLATTEAAATFSTMMVFVRCTKKVRHKLGHASEVARHAGRSLFVLMGGARKKERLTAALARKDEAGARGWKRIAWPAHHQAPSDDGKYTPWHRPEVTPATEIPGVSHVRGPTSSTYVWGYHPG